MDSKARGGVSVQEDPECQDPGVTWPPTCSRGSPAVTQRVPVRVEVGGSVARSFVKTGSLPL